MTVPRSVPETEAGVGTTEAEATAAIDAAPPAPETPARPTRRRSGVAFWMAVGWLAVVAFCALFATWLPVADPIIPQVSDNLAPPGPNNPLGTDGLGRDTLSRLVNGARVSLTVSLTAVTVGIVVGGGLGMMVGYFRGWFETVIMRIIDVILAFPGLVLLLVLLAYMGRSLVVISLVIGFLAIPIYTRVARANTLAVTQREFIRTARTMGAGHRRILVREILPNVVLPVAAFGLVAMGVVIVLEGTLAFLGLSVEAPQPTWGGMIFDGRRYLDEAPWVAAIPAAAMFLTVLSLNFVGDTLRTRFDVKDSRL
ncbi:ABC transporter permease [soil metagenome]